MTIRNMYDASVEAGYSHGDTSGTFHQGYTQGILKNFVYDDAKYFVNKAGADRHNTSRWTGWYLWKGFPIWSDAGAGRSTSLTAVTFGALT